MSRLPLDDLKVLDLTAARAGPQCVRQLSDWGADVIRVEPPDRRPTDMGDRRNSDFQNLHRNKRSLTLDLKSDAGRELFLRLAERADVVVENMRPAVKHRLGVDYEAVRAVNPRIVYASISAFGQDGPGSQRGGVDQIAQGMGGLMSVTGAPDGEPVRAGYAVTDLAAGLHAAVGILVALRDRDRSGEGAWVRTSLLEAAIGLLDFQAARYTVEGVVPPRVGNHHPTLVPMGTFATADGHVNIAAIDGRIWLELTRVLDLPELLEDPRFATVDLRMDQRDEINALVAARLRTRTTADVDRRPGGRGRPRGAGQRRRRGLRRRAGPAPGDGPAGRASRDGRAAPHRQRRDAGRPAAHAAHRGAGGGRAHGGDPRRAGPLPRRHRALSRRRGVLMPEHLQVADDGAITWLTFDHVARRNALTIAMCRSLLAELERIERDPEVHVVVLRGAGDDAFMSGADISEQDDPEAPKAITAWYAALAAMTKPVIAMVHGFCLGGGLATALEADLRIAAEGSLFGIPAARLGVGYPFDGVQRLVGLVGPAVAADILYTGRRLSAEEALAAGLVQELLPRADLEGRVAELAATIAGNAPLTIRAAKAAIRGRDRDAVARLVAECRASEDLAEGRRAFFEKRPPVFRGR